MDEKITRQIRGELVERRRRIMDTIQRSQSSLADGGGDDEKVAEIIDMAQNLEQIDRDKSMAEQERRELAAIDRALGKISSGEFGVCEECDEEIPSRRLLVLPEARLCARCQTFEERQQGRARGVPLARAG